MPCGFLCRPPSLPLPVLPPEPTPEPLPAALPVPLPLAVAFPAGTVDPVLRAVRHDFVVLEVQALELLDLHFMADPQWWV
jgi:hypothetical protein